MLRRAKTPKPASIQILVVAAGLFVLLAGYALLMHVTVDISRHTGKSEADARDLIYLYIHVGALVAAAALGFAAGKWLSGLGVAFALLFVLVLACAMAFAQAGSYELACRGQNDILRHWTC